MPWSLVSSPRWVARVRTKYFHFHDWTDDEESACTAATDGDSWFPACSMSNGSKDREKPDRASNERTRERERERERGEKGRDRGSGRMGGRRVLGTRRVSIKWLWPVRYGNSFPYGYAYARSESASVISFTRTYVCTYTTARRNNVFHGRIPDGEEPAVDLFRSKKATKLRDHQRESQVVFSFFSSARRECCLYVGSELRNDIPRSFLCTLGIFCWNVCRCFPVRMEQFGFFHALCSEGNTEERRYARYSKNFSTSRNYLWWNVVLRRLTRNRTVLHLYVRNV